MKLLILAAISSLLVAAEFNPDDWQPETIEIYKVVHTVDGIPHVYYRIEGDWHYLDGDGTQKVQENDPEYEQLEEFIDGKE